MNNTKQWLHKAMYILYIAGALPIIKIHTPDNDLYFLIATGREILNNGIPYLNPFHHMQNLEIIVQQWLGCILNYILYTRFHTAGLFAITVVYALLHLTAISSLLKLFTKSRKVIAVILPLEFIVMHPFFNLRGSLLTSSVLLWEVYILTQFVRKEKNKYLSLLPILSLFLINWQMAAWPLFLILTIPFFLPGRARDITAYYKEKRQILKKMALAVSISVAAGFINPYGIKGILYLAKSVGVLSAHIVEFSPVKALSLSATVSLIYFVLLFIYMMVKKENTDLRYAGLSLIGLLLSVTIQRNSWYSVLAFPTTASALEYLFQKKTLQSMWELLFTNKKSAYVRKIISVLFISIGCIAATRHIPYSAACEKNDNSFVPNSAIEYLNDLNRQEQEIKVMTEFNNGGYFSWHGYKIYMEPRPELYTKSINGQEDIYQEYNDSRSDSEKLHNLIRKYQFSHVITDKNTATYHLMKRQDDYKPVLSNNLNYQLFEYCK